MSTISSPASAKSLSLTHRAENVPRTRVSQLAELTKARLSSLVLFTTAVGYVLGVESAGGANIIVCLGTLIGTALAAGCASIFNQVFETRFDAMMHRTRSRPLPSRSFSIRGAIILAIALGVGGITLLTLAAGLLPAGLALLTILLYVAVYTPLKRRTTLNTFLGAVCGAIPPMIGWVAATGSLGRGAWVLGALLFIWQIPHFLALAWLYRADYARGGFAMLPVFDREGALTCRIVVLTSLMLVPLALTATLLGLAGWFYAIGATLLGLWMFVRSIKLYHQRTDANARSVFLASIAYLSLVLILLVLDRGSWNAPTIHQIAPAGSLALDLELNR